MKTKHGHSKGRVQTRAYKAWANMKSRCKSLGFFHHECDAAMAYNEAAYAALGDWAGLNEAPQWEVECG